MTLAEKIAAPSVPDLPTATANMKDLASPDSTLRRLVRAVVDEVDALRLQYMAQVFAQLGLDADLGSIQAFIGTHAPMPGELRLEDGPFWTPAQAQLLREERLDDADWAMVVDRLNVALHGRP